MTYIDNTLTYAGWLTEMLAAIEAAQQNLDSFVAAWGNENDVDNPEPADVLQAYADAEAALVGSPLNTANYLAADTDEVKAAKVAQNEAKLRADLAAEKAELQAATTAVNGVEGLKVAVDRFISAYEAAVAAAADADKASAAKADALTDADIFYSATGGSGDSYDYLDDTSGRWVVDASVEELIADGLSEALAGDYLEALAALAQAANAEADALAAANNTETTAQTRLDAVEAINADYVDAGGLDLTSDAAANLDGIAATYATEMTHVANAEQAILDHAALVDAIDAAAADVEDLRGLIEAHDAAVEALEEAGYVVEAMDAGVAVTYVATDASDVFLTTELDMGDSITISDFGLVGNDVIDATGYSKGTVGAGDNTKLELFIEQVGVNTVVTFETSEFGSNAQTPEVYTITLVGVNADALVLADGYLTLGA